MSSEGYINLGEYKVFTSDETDGFGYLTVQDAISCFTYFAQGRQFNHALEWCAGPGYFGLATLQTGLASKVSFSDISPKSQAVLDKTIDYNKLDCAFYLSDNFKNIPEQHFDLIVGNPPHFNFTLPDSGEFGNVGADEDRKMQDLDWNTHREFFNNVNQYLTDDGKIMLMENVTGSTPDTFSEMLKENNLTITNYSQSTKHTDYVYYIEISKIL